jgi:hypothetical protein
MNVIDYIPPKLLAQRTRDILIRVLARVILSVQIVDKSRKKRTILSSLMKVLER